MESTCQDSDLHLLESEALVWRSRPAASESHVLASGLKVRAFALDSDSFKLVNEVVCPENGVRGEFKPCTRQILG